MSDESNSPFVQLQQHSGYAVLCLHDPKRMNALSVELLAGFSQALDTVEQDEALLALVVTATGKAFCAGADIRELDRLATKQAVDYVRQIGELFGRLRKSRLLVIAAVNGYALGGGAELLLNCDLVYASEHAKIGFPESKLGLIPAASGSVLLPRILGETEAQELIGAGYIMTAKEAQALGLVSAVVEVDAGTYAEQQARQLIVSQSACKRWQDLPETELAGLLERERREFARCFDSERSRRLRAAFMHKK